MVTRRIPDPKIGGSIPSGVNFFSQAVLAEWLRRMLKAHVRKSVGSIPTDCTFFFPKTRRRWIRTTGTLIPHGFEIQALNLQSSSTQNAGCEDRTHDLWIMRPTLYQLSQPSFSKNYKLRGSNPCLFRDWRLKPAP
jgi:hypothetical protein